MGDGQPEQSQHEADFERMEAEVEEADEGIRELVAALREESDASLRCAIRYEGDDVDVVFVREDLRQHYSEPELDERVEALVIKALGDPQREGSLFDFGELDATIRWYDEVLLAQFPSGEWSGLVFTFDRNESPIVDLAQEYLRD